jgi:hypothetical protein
MTQNELVATITFRSGVISIYDVKGGFNHLGDVEKAIARTPSSSLHSRTDLELTTRLIEKDYSQTSGTN